MHPGLSASYDSQLIRALVSRAWGQVGWRYHIRLGVTYSRKFLSLWKSGCTQSQMGRGGWVSSTQRDGRSPFPICFGSGSLVSETLFLGQSYPNSHISGVARFPSLPESDLVLCFCVLHYIAGLFSDSTLVFDISAKEEIWCGSGWCWQSWLCEDKGLEGSTLFSIPKPDWICVQVRPTWFVLQDLWESQ